MDMACKAAYLPSDVLHMIFSHLSLNDIGSCALVCGNWHASLEYENSETWRTKMAELVPVGMAENELVCSEYLREYLKSAKKLLMVFQTGWNAAACSKNMVVQKECVTVIRRPVEQSTDAVRAKVGFTCGRHSWLFRFRSPLGTAAVVGLATDQMALHSVGYMPLVGNDQHSWGWNVVENVLRHNGIDYEDYPAQPKSISHRYSMSFSDSDGCTNIHRRVEPGDYITMRVDFDKRQAGFYVEDTYLGTAFKNFSVAETLYPCVSAVYGNSKIDILYLGVAKDLY